MTNVRKIALASALLVTLGSGTAAIAQNSGSQENATRQSQQQTKENGPRARKASFRKRHGKHAGRGGRRGGMMHILRQADQNNDGALTQEELDGYVAQTVTGADANSDGNITIQEFERIWMDMTRNRMADAFQRLDADASGTITAEERTKRFGNVVARMDRNDDGQLDATDRRGRKDRMDRHRKGGKHERRNRRNND